VVEQFTTLRLFNTAHFQSVKRELQADRIYLNNLNTKPPRIAVTTGECCRTTERMNLTFR